MTEIVEMKRTSDCGPTDPMWRKVVLPLILTILITLIGVVWSYNRSDISRLDANKVNRETYIVELQGLKDDVSDLKDSQKDILKSVQNIEKMVVIQAERSRKDR